MNIVIVGAQGSGKGTQAALLSRKMGIPHIDAGGLLREEVVKKTSVGLEIKKYMDQGELIPHDWVIAIVKKRVSNVDCKKGFILDGFPRNEYEAKALDSFARIDKVILLELDDRTAVKRLSARVHCSKCGVIYGITILPKKKGICDYCGGKLVKRTDDQPGPIRKRLEIYHKEITPVILHYTNVLEKVDASMPVEDVFEQIVKLIAK